MQKMGLHLHAKITAHILHYVFSLSVFIYIFERLFQIEHNLILISFFIKINISFKINKIRNLSNLSSYRCLNYFNFISY